jgi:hypothetical protein
MNDVQKKFRKRVKMNEESNVFLENILGLFEKSKGVPFVPKCKRTLLVPMLVFILHSFYGKGCYKRGRTNFILFC